MKNKSLFLLGLILLTFSSCEKEDEPELKETKAVIDVSQHFFNWIYFSFSENDTVTVPDFKNDLNWDLGIRYIHFRTNGGASGSGQGGVYDLGEIDFETVDISHIANATFIEDDSISVVKVMSNPPVWEKIPGNIPLENVFLTPAGPPPYTYAPNNHVYVIKTAKGKHAKFMATTFFNDSAEEGHVHFNFEFLD